ncbi:hypothetical protein ACFPRL_09815 [Pseudoclavibacter helvolus]
MVGAGNRPRGDERCLLLSDAIRVVVIASTFDREQCRRSSASPNCSDESRDCSERGYPFGDASPEFHLSPQASARFDVESMR